MGDIYQLFHAIALGTSVLGAASWTQRRPFQAAGERCWPAHTPCWLHGG